MKKYKGITTKDILMMIATAIMAIVVIYVMISAFIVVVKMVTNK